MTAWRRRLDSVNAWMERNLDLDDWLHGLSHRWRKVLALVGLIALVVYALSGMTQVNADEVGVVRRFGRVLDEDLQPGFYWRWPWPIEQVTRVPVRRLRSVEVGFRSVTGQTGGDTRTWSSPHGDAIQRYADESVMITGDDNLIEVLATVHYTIADVRTYLFDVKEPEDTLRFTTEAVLREMVAGRAFTPLLTRQREPLQQEALERLRERTGNLGLRLESLTLQELHPPPEVVPVFHDVARAMENEQEQINRARTAETERLAAAEAQRARLDLEGDADSKRILLQAKAALQVFLDRWNARGTLSVEQDLRLVWQTLLRAKATQTQEEINATYLKLRREELDAQVRWTGDRLKREVLAQTVPGREMVLIDAPPALASLLYTLDQLREILGPLWSSRLPRAPRGEEP
jgi:regulator of protease activity HflC (stomatin/prohibitin superfamily)